MLTHKFLIVFIRVFMFDQYFQAPLALVVTMIVMLAYSFARPFESTAIDRLQMSCIMCEALTLVIGILSSTVEGAEVYSAEVEACFFVVFSLTMLCVLYMSVSELKQYQKWGKIQEIGDEHAIQGLNPKKFVLGVFVPWLSLIHQTNNKADIQLFKQFVHDIKGCSYITHPLLSPDTGNCDCVQK